MKLLYETYSIVVVDSESEEYLMSTFSKRLKNYREKLKSKDSKWTQKYVASKIGVARVTYTAYENGTKMPPFDTINLIADLFEIKTDYLMGRTDDPNRSKVNEYDSLAEIKKIVDDLGIEDLFFHNMEDWKKLSPEDVEEIRNHFEYIVHKAKTRKTEDSE